jgi:nucleotide-binding universal stress UspA family protein
MKVLVAIDDSVYSKNLIDDVLDRQWNAGTEFNVVSVMDQSYRQKTFSQLFSPRSEIAASDRLKSYCRKTCRRLSTKIPNSSIGYEIRKGDAKTEIVKAAEDWKADKIIIGAHTRDICPRTMPGSVSYGVALLAKCDVEVVKTRDDTTFV